MKLKKYLKYNGIMLIDPKNEFHASCIRFYESRGFLSQKQLQSLKMYCFNPQDIARLTEKKAGKSAPKPAETSKPKRVALPPKKEKKVAKKVAKDLDTAGEYNIF